MDPTDGSMDMPMSASGGFPPPPGGTPPSAPPPGAPPPGAPPPGGFGPPPGGAPPGGFGAPPGGAPPGGETPNAVSFNDVVDNFKLLFDRSKSGILPAMVVMSVLWILLSTPQYLTNFLKLRALSEGDFDSMWVGTGIGACSGLWILVVAVLVGALRAGISRPMRRVMVEGPGAVQGVGDALKQCTHRYGMLVGAYLLTVIALVIGALLCILPMFVVMFFVAFVPYLVSACEADVVEAFKRSATYAQNQWQVLAGVLGGFVLIMVVVGCCVGGVTNALAVRIFGLSGTALVSPLLAIVGELVGLFVWLFFGATLITLETAETGTPIQR